jgi:hypothetical protein
MAKKPNTHYTPRTSSAACSHWRSPEDPTVASRQLAANGLKVDRRTLSDWKVRHAERRVVWQLRQFRQLRQLRQPEVQGEGGSRARRVGEPI